jgi:DNA adenine methylase
MKYMGSKNRIAKHILPIILKDRKEGQCYVETMVGGANLIDKVTGWRIGADFNKAVVDALIFIRDFTTPSNNDYYTESDYNAAAVNARCGNYLPLVDSYALIAFSFGAKWVGGWSRGKTSNGSARDYVSEQHRASEKQKPLLQGVSLLHSSYDKLEMPPQSIIYCDPPYSGTTKYKDDFDHDLFFEWCRDKTKEGHQVFISEYNAPADFVCVWQKEIQSGLNTNSTKKGVEKLFVHKEQLK